MLKMRQVFFGAAAAAAIAILPLAPAMAGGVGFRPLHAFGLGRGIVGAAAALATLPLTIASAVLSGAEPAAPAAGYGRPAYGYGPGYYRPAYYAPPPRVVYGPRPYYAPRAGRYGGGYYRGGGNPYPHR
jgi:hypothetical protein